MKYFNIRVCTVQLINYLKQDFINTLKQTSRGKKIFLNEFTNK